MLLTRIQDTSRPGHNNVVMVDKSICTSLSNSLNESSLKIVNYRENIQQWNDGSIYDGSFKNGLRDGSGEARWPNGEVCILC